MTSSPARFDAFVREFGEPAPRDEPPPDGPPDVERLVATAARHGIEISARPGCCLPSWAPAARRRRTGVG